MLWYGLPWQSIASEKRKNNDSMHAVINAATYLPAAACQSRLDAKDIEEKEEEKKKTKKKNVDLLLRAIIKMTHADTLLKFDKH